MGERASIGASIRPGVNSRAPHAFDGDMRLFPGVITTSTLGFVIVGCGAARQDTGPLPVAMTAVANPDVSSSDLSVPGRGAPTRNREPAEAAVGDDDALSASGCWRLDEFGSTDVARVVRPPPVRRRPITVTVLESDGTVFSGPVGLTRLVATATIDSEACRGGTGGVDIAREFVLNVPHKPSVLVGIEVTAWTPDAMRSGMGFVTLPADPGLPCAASIRLGPAAETALASRR